jgi:protein-S-isoprenylcysteine O-methyltransferase Ste14
MSTSTIFLLDHLHEIIWVVWVIYWQIAAIGVKAAIRTEPFYLRVAHLGPLFIAVALLCYPDSVPFLSGHVVPWTMIGFWIGTVVLIAGLGFATWARVELGRNWSATVAVKQEHELIRSGPYALVRHPIYTGIRAGFVGSAISEDRWCAVVAGLLVFIGFWFKLLREESAMHETFGPAYDQYATHTRRLVPFVL